MKDLFKKITSKYNIVCYVLITIICVLAFQVREPMATMRLPYLHHYDELFIARDGLNMLKKDDYIAKGYGLGYGGFMIYSCVAIDYIHFQFLKKNDPIISKTKSFSSVLTDKEYYYRNPSHPSFYYWNRIFVAILSTAGFLVLFLIGKYFKSPWVGVFAAGVLLTSFFNFETASTINVDVPGGFWAMLAILFSVIFVDNPKIRYLYLSALMAGMAISTKVSFAIVCFVPFMAFLLRINLFWSYFKSPKLLLKIVGIAIVPFVLYVLWNPALYLNTEEMIKILKWTTIGYRDPNTGHFSKAPGMEHFLFQVSEMRRSMPVFFELSLIGVFLSFIKIARTENKMEFSLFFNKKSIVLLVFPIIYMAFMSQNTVAYHRNFFVMYYFICLYCAFTAIFFMDFLMDFLQKGISTLEKKWVRNTIMFVGFGAAWVFHLSKQYAGLKYLASPAIYLSKDTRTKTTDWLNEQPSHTVAFAKELRMSPVDLGNLKAKHIIFSQRNNTLDSILNIYPLVVVSEYKSKYPDFTSGDSLINKQFKLLKPLFSIKGELMFRDTTDTYFMDIDPKIMVFSKTLDSITVRKTK